MNKIRKWYREHFSLTNEWKYKEDLLLVNVYYHYSTRMFNFSLLNFSVKIWF